MLKKKLKTKVTAKATAPKKKLGVKLKTKTKKVAVRGHQEPVVKKKKKVAEAPVKKKGLKKTKSAAPAKKIGKAAKPVKKVARKTARAKAPASMNKSQMIGYYMEKLEWDRGDVVAFLNAQEELLMRSLRKNGMFVLPGVLKIVAKKKPPQKMPAIKKGTMVKGFGGVEVKSPGRAAFTKPASVRFGARGMKKLKEAVLGG